MEVGKERSDLGSYLTMGAEIIESDWHKGDIFVERRGLLRPKYLFIHNDQQIASLSWKRTRRSLYEGKNIKLDLEIGTMGKRIIARDDMSRISHLIVKSPLNPRKAKMLIGLSDSDDFIVRQECEDRNRKNFSLHVTKRHYVTELITFAFSLDERRSHSIARINVPAIMRWEAHHFHHLVALVMSRIVFVQEHGISRNQRRKYARERLPVGKHKWQFI